MKSATANARSLNEDHPKWTNLRTFLPLAQQPTKGNAMATVACKLRYKFCFMSCRLLAASSKSSACGRKQHASGR